MRWRGEASRAVWETCDVEDCKEPPDSLIVRVDVASR